MVALQNFPFGGNSQLTRWRWAHVLAILATSGYVLRRVLWLHAEQPNYPGFAWDIAGIVCAAIGLFSLTLGRWPKRSSWLLPALAGAALGLLFFVATLGFALVDPSRVEWLMRGDWAQHFVGWHIYRNSAWMWPPGAFDAIMYPVGTSISYTDSLPLFAMPLKLLSSWLPTRFQYIGLWQLINCVLQGAFGALLVRCFSPSYVVQLIGAGFLLLAPVFISRIDHDTLTTQWILLAGLWLYFDHLEARRSFAGWLALSAVSALVHPYLSAMLVAIAFAYYLREVCADRRLTVRAAAVHFAAVLGITLLGFWLSGGFLVRPSGAGVHLGVYNANLLAWIDPQFMSRWLPTLPASHSGQYEGRAYLGLGTIVLIGIGLVMLAIKPSPRISPQRLWPLVLVVVLMTLFAFGTKFTIGASTLFDMTPDGRTPFDAFRSSGRFIWASCYLLTIFGIVVLTARGGRFAVPLLAVGLAVQLFDLTPLHARTFHLREGVNNRSAEPVLNDPWWNEAVRGRRHIVLVPPLACSDQAAPYFPFSLLAGDQGMTVNVGYVARWDGRAYARYCSTLKQEIPTGVRDAATLYVVRSDEVENFRNSSQADMQCKPADGYVGCFVAHPD